MSKLYILGSVYLEEFLDLDSSISKSNTCYVTDSNFNIAGKGYFQSISASKIVDTNFITLIPEPLIAIKDDFKKNNINIDLSKTIKSKVPKKTYLVFENTEKLLIEPASNFKFEKDFILDSLNSLNKDDYLLFQNEVNNLDLILELAKEKTSNIILNLSPLSLSYKNLEIAKYLIFDLFQLVSVYQTKDFKVIVNNLRKTFPDQICIIKNQNKDIYYIKNLKISKVSYPDLNSLIHFEDIFVGAFSAHIASGENLKNSIKNAIKLELEAINN